jgi:hypothetical protein
MEKTITISYNEYLELVAKKEAYDNGSVIIKEESFDEKYTSMHRDEELKSEIEKRKSIEQLYSDYKQECRDKIIKSKQHYDNEISDLKHKLRHANDRGDKFEREFNHLWGKYNSNKNTLDELLKRSIREFLKWRKQYLK